jgi:carbonic anhydrase/acetyltransferase-like protein (isoleucine patch superfamily)
MAVYQLAEHTPELGPDTWVADSAQVIGQVQLGAQASVWYGAVIRGDNDHIRIGARSNVQEHSVLHVDRGVPLHIGEDVTVGHQVVLHGCSIGDGTLVGIGSVVLNRARIGKHCLVAAGALVLEGAEFPDGVLIVGSPAKVKRELSAEEIARLQASAAHYVQQAQLHGTRLSRVG